MILELLVIPIDFDVLLRDFLLHGEVWNARELLASSLELTTHSQSAPYHLFTAAMTGAQTKKLPPREVSRR